MSSLRSDGTCVQLVSPQFHFSSRETLIFCDFSTRQQTCYEPPDGDEAFRKQKDQPSTSDTSRCKGRVCDYVVDLEYPWHTLIMILKFEHRPDSSALSISCFRPSSIIVHTSFFRWFTSTRFPSFSVSRLCYCFRFYYFEFQYRSYLMRHRDRPITSASTRMQWSLLNFSLT